MLVESVYGHEEFIIRRSRLLDIEFWRHTCGYLGFYQVLCAAFANKWLL